MRSESSPRWNKTRWRCREDYCTKSSFTETIAQVPARLRTTGRLRTQIGAAVGDAAPSVTEVAAAHGVSWPTAHRAFIDHADALLSEPEPTRVLGIDETRRGKPRWEYCTETQRWVRVDPWDTGFVDLADHQGLLGREGRTGAALVAWLRAHLAVPRRHRVRGHRPRGRLRVGDPHTVAAAEHADRGRPLLRRPPGYTDVGWVEAGHGGDDAGEVGIISGSGGRSSGRRLVACIVLVGFRLAWLGSRRSPSWSCRRAGRPVWFRCFRGQSAMTVLSIPAVSSRIAAVCLSTCGVTVLVVRLGQDIAAVAVCCARRAATASPLIRVPVRVGNTNLSAAAGESFGGLVDEGGGQVEAVIGHGVSQFCEGDWCAVSAAVGGPSGVARVNPAEPGGKLGGGFRPRAGASTMGPKCRRSRTAQREPSASEAAAETGEPPGVG